METGPQPDDAYSPETKYFLPELDPGRKQN